MVCSTEKVSGIQTAGTVQRDKTRDTEEFQKYSRASISKTHWLGYGSRYWVKNDAIFFVCVLGVGKAIFGLIFSKFCILNNVIIHLH